ncbi:hypothetical protein SAMN05444166_2038 [Singulisphaera sp. GP187]|uniref:hypothetical protein n=1 Tax=Singulisphaera sp. GP187 TaxID=1882752 RepID=UPI0009285E82|nr:hypothetical protein [Singulisphaera sp. GP187]SIO01352.1 hypothetical protein SAMN05444166_2038 [Singulisphaera sp. GP187]
MVLAPEPYLSACLETIREAVLGTRQHCWGRSASPEQIADLMDAIHNIPVLLNNWERCDVEWLRAYLKAYDEKWGEGQSWLCAVFDKVIEAGQDV